MTKWEHPIKGFTCTYNVEVLDPCDPELQLKDAECAIKS